MASGVDPSALRAARERAGLTQHELARLVGAAGGERVSRWELGTSQPRPAFLLRLARILDIDVGDLVRHDGEAPDLRALRLRAGLTVPDLVRTTNLSEPTYIRWESGQWTKLPSAASIAVLAGALGVPTDMATVAFHQARRARRQSDTP